MQDGQQPNRILRAAAAFRRNLKTMDIAPHEEARFLDDIMRGAVFAAIPIVFLIVWLLH